MSVKTGEIGISQKKESFAMKVKFFIMLLTGLFFAGGLLLCSAAKVQEMTQDWDFDVEDEMSISKTFKVSPGAELIVTSTVADVKIYPGSSNEITVRFSAKGSSRLLKRFDVKFDQRDNSVEISVKKRASFFNLFEFEGVSALLEISVPESVDIVLKTAGADVDVKNLTGKIEVSSAGGDIKLWNLRGEATLKNSGGDILVSDFYGEIEASITGGDLNVDFLKGGLKASSTGGDVEVGFDSVGTSNISTTGGDIIMVVPAETKAEIDFDTSGGEIKIDLPLNLVEKGRGNVHGFIGGRSDVKIRAKTSGGDIILKSKEEQI